jgi:hypothetical protein
MLGGASEEKTTGVCEGFALALGSRWKIVRGGRAADSVFVTAELRAGAT